MFTAPSIHGPAGLQGLDGLAALGSPALLSTALSTRFGRLARSHPAKPRGRAHAVRPVSAMRREGLAATVARRFARGLAWLAQAAKRRGRQWARARERRLTETALRRLDSRTLRDIGLTHSEIPSMAAECAGQVEATRARAWRELGSPVF